MKNIMKKIKKHNENVRKKMLNVRYSSEEYSVLKKMAQKANQLPSTYCREISLLGFIIEKPNPFDMNEVRLLKQILMEDRTHFSRLGNLIKTADPLLHNEIRVLKNRIEKTLEKFKL